MLLPFIAVLLMLAALCGFGSGFDRMPEVSPLVALAFGGAHWRRVELTRLGYAALALVAIKLVTEDLRHGHLAYIAASIFLVAMTLIVAPRVARTRQKTRDTA